MAVSKKIVLHFPARISNKPIVTRLVRDFNLDFNILKASISPDEGGLLVLELTGEQNDYDRGITYLTRTGVKIQALSQDVTHNEERCSHCGVCISVCPTRAFVLEPKTRRVLFENDKCIACGVCIKACPPRAMELHFS